MEGRGIAAFPVWRCEMNRKKGCVRVFAGAAAFAYALYALTLPEGLPWGTSATMSGTWMAVALAVGLLGSLVTRYLGWRCGAAAALVFTCVPEVWNRTILGERGMAFVAFALCGLWFLNAILLAFFRKAHEAQKAAPAVIEGATAAHDETQKRGKINGIAAWIFLGLAALYATVSIALHDYKLGEPASVFAKGVVEEAGERIVVLNGVLDEQIENELKLKCEVEVEERNCSGFNSVGQHNKKADIHSSTSTLHFNSGASLTSHFDFQAISLRRDEAYRTNLVAWVRSDFPGETNLYLAAQVSVAAFLDVAVKAHPERFYLMNGKSSTLAGWEKRWEAMKPYLKSRDPFVPVARRMFGHEGNAVGNVLVDAAPMAYALYKRIYEEIDPGNISALINMSEMIRRGYKVKVDEKKWVTDKLNAFFKDESNRRHVREIVHYYGPVRQDPELTAKIVAESEKTRVRLNEQLAAGEEVKLPPEVQAVFEQNDRMVLAMGTNDLATASKIARTLLSKPAWRDWAPANAVMGEVMVAEGDYAAAEAFFRTALADGREAPDVVVNNYADVLMKLGKMDEAERILRVLVAKRGEAAWGPRFTLAEVLTKKVEKVGGGGQRSFEPVQQEVRELVAVVMKHAPGEMKQLMREKQRKGEILK